MLSMQGRNRQHRFPTRPNRSLSSRFAYRKPSIFAELSKLAPQVLFVRRPRSTASIGNPPDRAVAVFGYQQCAIVRHRHANRPAPNGLIISDKPGHEVIIFARGHAIIKPKAGELIPGAGGAVPRAVQRDKGIAPIPAGMPRRPWSRCRRSFRARPSATVPEHPAQWPCRRDPAARRHGAGPQTCPYNTTASREYSAFLHAGNVIRHQVVPQTVALVGGYPHLARDRVDGHAHAVANAGWHRCATARVPRGQ